MASGSDSSPGRRERRRERKERGERRERGGSPDRRARDKERSRRRDRSRSRSRSRDRDRDRGGRDRTREGGRSDSKRERPRGGDSDSDGARAKHRRSASPAAAPPPAAAEEDEAAAEARRAEEQAKLDAEMERRRKRVEAWQEQRRKQQAEAAGGAGADASAGAADVAREANGGAAGGSGDAEGDAPRAKGWTLDGDDDDEEEEEDAPAAAAAADADADAAGAAPAAATQPGDAATPATQPPDADGTPGAMAVDPPAVVAPAEPQGGENDEVDPLDAFMAAQVMPEVARLRAEDADAYAQETAHYAAAAADAAPVPPPLEGEADDDVADPLDAFMAANAAAVTQQQPVGAAAAAPQPAGSGVRPAAGRPAVVVRPAGFKGLVIKPPGAAAAGAGAAAAGNGIRAEASSAAAAKPSAASAAAARGTLRRAFGGGSSSSSSGGGDGGDSSDEDDAAWAKKAMAGKASKADRLGVPDHSAVDYAPFRKAFYIESAEMARMTPAEVAEMRRGALEGVKCRGRDVPRPIKAWTQAGLTGKVLEVLRKLGHEAPLPIQAQALPVIMSGRDCIGIAKTGSGKTLAFLLPLLRHAKDQPPLAQGDGPIGLIIAPTRELVTQIAREAKRFAHAVSLSAACVYGGSGVAAQIGDLKRGAEIVVCTPGRLIDIIATSNGRVTNLRRVTYLVLDEADRMFDMGFEPQISRIIAGTRPDRQTVMFSATFPHSMELLARSALQSPVEIQVGGRSVVNPDIEQYVEIRPEEERFLRLLELLGQWYEAGKILVFVHTQEKCDAVFRDLLRAGYPCLSLHGGKEQSDRECTIADFKSDVCNVLVATSVAARGLDVKSLRLVVNYDVPNHHEDYVHRCGRTGRAGAKGTAVTFIAPDEERYAPDLVKALKESGRPVPEDLAALADSFARKRKDGLALAHGSGFGGSGFKFDLLEEGRTKAERKAERKARAIAEYGADAAELASSDDEEELDDKADAKPDMDTIVQTRGAGAAPQQQPGMMQQQQQQPQQMAAAPAPMTAAQQAAAGVTAAQAAAVAAFQAAAAAKVNASMAGALTLLPAGGAAAAAAAARAGFGPGTLMPIGAAPLQAGPLCPPPPGSGGQSAHAALQAAAAAAAALSGGAATPAQRAAAFAASLTAAQRGGGLPGGPPGGMMQPGGAAQADHFELEIEINDFPQHARWKVTHKDSLRDITDFTGAAITAKGQFVPPGKPLAAGERKLYLLVEGPTERSVREAKVKIREILEVAAQRDVLPGGFGAGGGGAGGASQGRYSVV